MKQFTTFTLIYLATGVCLTAITLQSSGITSNTKTVLLLDAGLLYLLAVLSTFSFWRQSVVRSQHKLRDQSAWKQNFVAISPWIVIALTIFASICSLLGQNWTIEAIAKAALGLPVILVSAENILVRSQTLQ